MKDKHRQPVCLLDADCPLRQIFDIIGNRWTSVVLFVLDDHVMRYSDLQRQIPDVSKKMLTQTLRSLEHDGLVRRTVYPVVPPKTEYRLTPLGVRMREPIVGLAKWGKAHQKELKSIGARRNEQRRDPNPSFGKDNKAD
jgi:DNA-binding HxlR family transcriptional regulator